MYIGGERARGARNTGGGVKCANAAEDMENEPSRCSAARPLCTRARMRTCLLNDNNNTAEPITTQQQHRAYRRVHHLSYSCFCFCCYKAFFFLFLYIAVYILLCRSTVVVVVVCCSLKKNYNALGRHINIFSTNI